MGTVRELSQASAAERQARIDLAAAFRLAVRLDLHEGVCNHFSLMLPQGERFLLNRYGLHWSEVSASNLLAVDAAGNLLEGEGEIEKTAFFIHSRIHRANPRASCVLHTHMPYATALTLTEPGRLEMVEQNALRFLDDIAYDDTYNGLVVDEAEGDRLARVLGSKRVMFLANHGVIVVGTTVAEAFDALPIARAVSAFFTGNREYSNLPRKFKFAFDGCAHRDCIAGAIVTDGGSGPPAARAMSSGRPTRMTGSRGCSRRRRTSAS